MPPSSAALSESRKEQQDTVNAGRLRQNEDAAPLHLAVHKWSRNDLIHALENFNMHDKAVTDQFRAHGERKRRSAGVLNHLFLVLSRGAE